jgi:hypothetical protein
MSFREQAVGTLAVRRLSCCLRFVAGASIIFACSLLSAEQVPVRHKEGLVHGFLVLRTLDGQTLASGALIQNVRKDGTVSSRLVFHFKDGSLHDETVLFSQRGTFRMISDHLVQKGPAFQHPVDATLDGNSGQITVRYSEDGKEKTATDRLKNRPDVANGLMFILLKNINPNAPQSKVSFVAFTPKPKLVGLAITPVGTETFATAAESRKSTHFVVRPEIPGMTGVLASVLGKQPPDINVWILEGEAPAFIKSEGPLAFGGPIWRVELVSPTWPKEANEPKKNR